MKLLTVEEVINHTKIKYQKDTSKKLERLKATGEYFTPSNIIIDSLKEIVDKEELSKNFVDRMCGDGNWLVEVLILKMQNGMNFESALKTLWGSDLMQDNIDLCRDRLLCNQTHLRHIVDKQIICGDTFKNPFFETESFGPDNLFTIQP